MERCGRRRRFHLRLPAPPRHRDKRIQSAFAPKESGRQLPPACPRWCHRDMKNILTWCNNGGHEENQSRPWFVVAEMKEPGCSPNADGTGLKRVLSMAAQLQDRRSKPESSRPQDARAIPPEPSLHLKQAAGQYSTSRHGALPP